MNPTSAVYTYIKVHGRKITIIVYKNECKTSDVIRPIIYILFTNSGEKNIDGIFLW